jgi:hypothetical protein
MSDWVGNTVKSGPRREQHNGLFKVVKIEPRPPDLERRQILVTKRERFVIRTFGIKNTLSVRMQRA